MCPPSAFERMVKSVAALASWLNTVHWSAFTGQGAFAVAAKAAPMQRGDGYTDAASLSSLSVLVASRYSCTHRSMTAEVFSTLVNCPTT